MSDFFRLIFEFPTVLFTFALGVLLLYWVFTIVTGGLDLDVGDADIDIDMEMDADGDGEGGGLLASLLMSLGLGGVPVMISISLLVLFAWFFCLVGAVLLDSQTGAVATAGLIGTLIGSFVISVMITRMFVAPLRRVFVPAHAQARADFVGRVCTIRTMHVTDRYGQAEVTSDDGSTAVIQVRSDDPSALGAGAIAVIHTLDVEGEFFWVTPLDPIIGAD